MPPCAYCQSSSETIHHLFAACPIVTDFCRSVYFFIYLGLTLLSRHCTGHITTGSWKGRGNQYIQLVKFLYCKLLTNASNYHLSHLRSGREPNPDLRGKSVTTLPPWPPGEVLDNGFNHLACIVISHQPLLCIGVTMS